jgi:hypothetical protein
MKLIRVMIGVQLFRLVGLTFLIESYRGNLPFSHGAPTGVGDAMIALTAPLIAYSLGRGGIKTWATALVWNALGITDLVYAITGGLLGLPDTQYVLTSYLVIVPTVFVPIAIILHIVTIVLLLRKGVVSTFTSRSAC